MPLEELAPFSRLYLFLFVALFLLGLTTRSRILRTLISLPVAYVLLYPIFRTTTGLRNEEWQIGTMLAIELFTASDYLLVTNVQELQLVEQRELISNRPFLERLKWAIHLTLSSRGIGWKHEPTYALPPRSSTTTFPSRRSFISFQMPRIIFFACLFQGMRYLNRMNPLFAMNSPGLGAEGWLWRFYSMISFALPIYAYINFQNRMYNIVLVATGISNPTECLPIFGDWQSAYTLRKFWGRTWHQIFRRFVSAHGKFFANRTFGFKKGTFGSAYIQLFTAFIISGIVHQFGEYMLTRETPSLVPSIRHDGSLDFGAGGSFWFFVLQAMAIMCEDFTIRAAKSLGYGQGSSRSDTRWKIIGYIWVFGWFTWSMPVWLNNVVAAGLMDEKHQGGFTLEFVFFAILWRGKKTL